jgi:hypothetical protein
MTEDFVPPLASLVWHRRHQDMVVVDVPTTTWHAHIRSRDRPVLLEQPVDEFHQHVPAVRGVFPFLVPKDPTLLSCFVLRNSHPFPLVIVVGGVWPD